MPKAARLPLPALLIAAVYCGWAPVEFISPDSSNAMLAVWTVAVLIAGAANVANACLDRGKGSPRRLAFCAFALHAVEARCRIRRGQSSRNGSGRRATRSASTQA